MTAPTMPERANGRTAVRIASQRVAPSASAPSRRTCRRGAQHVAGDRRDRRQDHDREDDARRRACRSRAAGPRRAGRKPSVLPRNGSTVVAQPRARARRCPTGRRRRSGSPRAARRGSRAGARSHARRELGRGRWRCRARPARRSTSASSDETTVPKMNGSAPNCSCTGSQSVRGRGSRARTCARLGRRRAQHLDRHRRRAMTTMPPAKTAVDPAEDAIAEVDLAPRASARGSASSVSCGVGASRAGRGAACRLPSVPSASPLPWPRPRPGAARSRDRRPSFWPSWMRPPEELGERLALGRVGRVLRRRGCR